ncbi:hypothetical protein GOB57_24185 [Sinorhizobium meliloti]|nr:hypothetical protein [Sinorhizobium meliloti]
MGNIVRAIFQDGDYVTMSVVPGDSVRMHDRHGDPESLSRLFPWPSSRVLEVFSAARSSDELARLVREFVPDVVVHGLVTGRTSLKLTTRTRNHFLVHLDPDGTVTMHGADLQPIALSVIFKPGVTDAIKGVISAANSASDMANIIRPYLNSTIAGIERFTPFPAKKDAAATSLDDALDLIEKMLDPDFDPDTAKAFLLEHGRAINVNAHPTRFGF